MRHTSAAEASGAVVMHPNAACAICSTDPVTGQRGTNATTHICPQCRLDPANIDWNESAADRPAPTTRIGMLEEFLFQNLRQIVRQEVRAALADSGVTRPTATAMPSGTEYLSVSEAAGVARLHHGTIREWIKDGSLRACRAGRVYRIRRADLDERLTSRLADPVAAKVEDRVSAILAKQASRAA
jgi:excisionase family DNA binding protein